MSNLSAETIIIGAGISGVKSAIELSKAGISTLILESRDRLGGRLHTEKLKSGIPIDLGASWLHDCLDNPLLEKYWKSGKIDFNFDDGSFSMFNDQGRIDDNQRLKPICDEIKLYLRNLYDSKTPKNDISVKEAVFNYLNEKKYLLNDYQLKYVPQLVRYFELWIGSSWEILSARTISADEHKGRDAMILNGYQTLYHCELDELKETNNYEIKLENIVYKIKWDDKNNNIIVFTRSPDKKINYSYTCRYLIVTVPLSVLKLTNYNETGSIQWEPKLPKSLTKSLDGVSFSNLGKVYFEFPEIFWNLNDDRLFSFANVDERYLQCIHSGGKMRFDIKRNDCQLKLDGAVPNGLDYSILFMNLAKPTGKPLILALISSPLTQYIEESSSETIFEVFKPVFQRISGKKDIAKPVEIRTSKWSSDPFARGSYTGVTVGDDYETALNELLNPTSIFDGKGRVRFAGEGIIDDGNGCAHAAWVAGKREAENIKMMINRSKL